jgi:hypothetical protein
MTVVIPGKAEARIAKRVAGKPTAYAFGIAEQKPSLFAEGFSFASQEHRHCETGVLR